jgi:ankyrin repeat protein
MDPPNAKGEPDSGGSVADAATDIELHEDEDAPRVLLTGMLDDADGGFQVAVSGQRNRQHLARRHELLTSMSAETAAATPPAALEWMRAVEDKLLEEIETLQDDLYTSQAREVQLVATNQLRREEAEQMAKELRDEINGLNRQLRLANVRIDSLSRRVQSPTAPSPQHNFVEKQTAFPTATPRLHIGHAANTAVPANPQATVPSMGIPLRTAQSAGVPRPGVPQPTFTARTPIAGTSGVGPVKISMPPTIPPFTISPTGLPTFNGQMQDLMTAQSFINILQRCFESRAMGLGRVDPHSGMINTEMWSMTAMQLLRGEAARWANSAFPQGTHTRWESFTLEFIRKFTPANAVGKLQLEWETLSIKPTERAAAFNNRFKELRNRLEPFAPLPADRMLDAYRAKLQGNKGVAAIYGTLASMHPQWTLEEYMAQVAESDAIQHGAQGVISTPAKATPKRMEKKPMTRTGTAGEMGCSKCNEKGHEARNCPHKVITPLLLRESKKRKVSTKTEPAQGTPKVRVQSHASLVKLPIELLRMIGHYIIDGDDKDDEDYDYWDDDWDDEARLKDLQSFRQVNRALYTCLNDMFWRRIFTDSERHYPDFMAEHIFTELIEENDLARLQFFLEAGADIETPLKEFSTYREISGRDTTPLIAAAFLDNVPMAHLFLKNGAKTQWDPDRRMKQGFGAMHAVRSAEMVRLFLDFHADPEIGDQNDMRPLHWYASRGNVAAMRAVLQHGVKVDPVSSGGATPLQEAAACSLDAVKILLEFGADVQKTDGRSNTPLHYAARAGQTEVVRLLLERWPDGVRVANVDLDTPLHRAALEGKAKVVRVLVESWPEGVKMQNKALDTPLHLAAEMGNINIVRALVERWPEGIKLQNENLDTPLHRAVRARPCYEASVMAPVVQVVKLLMGRWHQGIKVQNKTLDTPLHVAAEAGNIEVMRFLVASWRKGLQAKGMNSEIPLHRAAASGKTEMVKLLVERWPDGVKAKNEKLDTPLHRAAAMGRDETLRLLAELWPQGMSVKNKAGQMPNVKNIPRHGEGGT